MHALEVHQIHKKLKTTEPLSNLQYLYYKVKYKYTIIIAVIDSIARTIEYVQYGI